MNRIHRRRVVVTGLGVVTSLGHDATRVFDALCRGETGIRKIQRFDTTHCPAKLGGIIEDLDASAIVRDRAGQRLLRTADWVQTLGLCAASLACEDARLGPETVAPERLGVFFGAGRGGARVSQEIFGLLLEALARWRAFRLRARLLGGLLRVFNAVKPTHYLQQCPCFVSAYASIRFQARGPSLTNVNLCSAGAQAIGEAAWVIARDDADVMIAGGADSMLNPAELTAFCALDAVSTRNEDGPAASRPFDLRRDGCVVGEGGAAVVLEELNHARSRRAPVYAELLGYGASSDAHKVTAPPEDGRGAVQAMREALRHAGISPEDVGHINAHGTSTPLNDRVETTAIKTVLGRHAHRIPVVSTKSMTGHLIAAAGALEAVVAVKSLQEKRIPPTLNLRVPDPRCDLDYAPEGQRRLPGLRVVLSNSFAVGGSNASLVFGEPS
jgi:3-oxoacyl-[acyl-carrier-protein] synthase II